MKIYKKLDLNFCLRARVPEMTQNHICGETNHSKLNRKLFPKIWITPVCGGNFVVWLFFLVKKYNGDKLTHKSRNFMLKFRPTREMNRHEQTQKHGVGRREGRNPTLCPIPMYRVHRMPMGGRGSVARWWGPGIGPRITPLDNPLQAPLEEQKEKQSANQNWKIQN